MSVAREQGLAENAKPPLAMETPDTDPPAVRPQGRGGNHPGRGAPPAEPP